MHLVIGRKTLVWASKASGISEPAPLPLSLGQGKPGECVLGQKPMDQRDFVEIQPSREVIPACCWSKIIIVIVKHEFGCSEDCNFASAIASPRKHCLGQN